VTAPFLEWSFKLDDDKTLLVCIVIFDSESIKSNVTVADQLVHCHILTEKHVKEKKYI
jgi:hypothetical protein